MNLVTNINTQQILNLAYYGENENIRQSEKLMKNGFLNTNSEEYGYYYITYRSRRTYSTGLGYVITDLFSATGEGFGETLSFFYASIKYLPLAPIFIPMGVISTIPPLIYGTAGILFSAATPPLLLFGVPSEFANFNLKADLYIFDSAGNIIKHFEKTGSFRQVAGLYYGRNPTKNAARAFSGLFEEIFQMANIESCEINQLLIDAGPITEENKKQAVENINTYLVDFMVLPSGDSSSFSPGL
jgi:hypothetical protein